MSTFVLLAAGSSSDSGPSFWTVAGPAIAVVAIGVSVFLWWRSRERRSLAYSVAVTQLVRHEARGRVGIVYDGNPVGDPHIVEMTVVNSGNAALKGDDFETSLQIALGDNTRVLSVDVAAVEPDNLAPQIVAGEHALDVEPLLLNPRDGFSVQILVSDGPGEIRLNGRIAGVRQFESSINTPRDRLVATSLKLTLPFVGVVLERELPSRGEI